MQKINHIPEHWIVNKTQKDFQGQLVNLISIHVPLGDHLWVAEINKELFLQDVNESESEFESKLITHIKH